MTSKPSRTRARGRLPFHSMLYWLSIPRFPKLTAASARPPVNSSSVASIWATSVGSRRIRWVTFGPIRICLVLSAAAANSSHGSLW